jgi:hypothetical protein
MPRASGTTFGDLIGKLGVVVVGCPKCNRTGRYVLRRLINERGRDGTILEWLDELTADCRPPTNISEGKGRMGSKRQKAIAC